MKIECEKKDAPNLNSVESFKSSGILALISALYVCFEQFFWCIGGES